MPEDNPDYLSAIHQLLVQHYNAEELRSLCFRLGVDYDDLPPGGRESKARELITYLNRRGRLPELKAAVKADRPSAVWRTAAGGGAMPTSQSAAAAQWQLRQPDFDRLAGLLANMPEFRTVNGRVDFLDDVFAGSPRKNDLLSLINLDGNPRGVAVRVITRLVQFGQDKSGQETLGVLINKLLTYLGSGPDADFLRGLFDTYPLTGTPVSVRGVTDWRGHERPAEVQEKIIGENTLRDVRLLELALRASHSVVRIVTSDSMGSGFLVGPGLIMTNHHVIGSQNAAMPCAFQFNYQLNLDLQPAPVHTARTKPGGLFYTNAALDVTVVEVIDLPPNSTPLTLSRQPVRKDERVNIIQHPGGHYKKISMQNNFVAFANAQVLQYLTTTEPGSSGSPVFNNEFVVVGIHHSGGLLQEPGSGAEYLRNAGSRMTAVLDDLQQNAPDIYEQLQKA